jgi:diguanylate cyclase (GGDEF)-like protein
LKGLAWSVFGPIGPVMTPTTRQSDTDLQRPVTSGPPTPHPDLSSTVNGSFRLVVAGALMVVVLLVSLLAWLSISSRPAVARYERGLTQLASERGAMLDEETGLRGFLLTGRTAYLAPYQQGKQDLAVADAGLTSLTGDSALAAVLFDLRVAQQRWVDEWATPAVAGHPALTDLDGPASAPFLALGKALFDGYRVQQARAVASVTVRVDRLRREQTVVLATVASGAALVALLNGVVAFELRRRLRQRILGPVEILLSGVAAVRAGHLDDPLHARGPVELIEVIDGFNEMTASLAHARNAAAQSEQRIAAQAEQLSSILGMVREIGGSLNVTYVLSAVSAGAISISGARRATVWLLDESGEQLDCVWGPDPDRAVPPSIGLDSVPIGTAAKHRRTTHGPTHGQVPGSEVVAVPLVVGARVTGVLELTLDGGRALDRDQLEVLETLSIHAATAIESALLHEHASHASEHDGLTGLANRRRLESDLQLECERSRRYGNPLAFIMCDLDNFKQLNDTYGHPEGDVVLQTVAQIIQATLRSTDTAYRYGGEELAVLARESDLESGLKLAERLRAAIGERFHGTGTQIALTGSFGVAHLRSDATAHELISDADAALYAAKLAGRNRVHAAVEGRAVQR